MAQYSFNINLEEILILLFYKKSCPKCGSRLKRINKKKFIGKGYSINEVAYNGEKYEVDISFYCNNCNKMFEILELKSLKKKL